MPAHHKLSTEARLQVSDRYLGGESASALGRAFGVSTRTVLNILKERGVPVRPPKERYVQPKPRPQPIPEEKVQAVWLLVDQRVPWKEIGSRVGLSNNAVEHLLP